MKNEKLKYNFFDIIIYIIFIMITFMDFANSLNNETSILVTTTFLFIGILSIIFFITDRGDITIDKIIYIFTYLFCYYAPFHQYIDKYIIHGTVYFSDNDYFYANIVILIFLLIYTMVKRLFLKKLNFKMLKSRNNIKINSIALIILFILNLFSIVSLFKSGLLFSVSEIENNSTGIYMTLLRMRRFLPVSTLLIIIFAERKKVITVKNNILKKFLIICIIVINLIMYFPINGAIGRYLLFGTYIMIIYALVKKIKCKSLIILITAIGFYYIFPAFNFFKLHTLKDLSQFQLGGFNTNFIDYDAYQLLMLSMKYVKSHGVSYGTNILTALLCFIPRSIFTKKLNPSGEIIGEYYGFKYTNISCPLFAEFYIAGGIITLFIFTISFAFVNNYIEKKMKVNDILYNGIYCISLGIVLSILRGALLPTMSIYFCLNIVYIFVYSICKITMKRSIESEKE